MRKFFALILAATVFAACSNDDDGELPDGGGTVDPSGTAWMSLKIQSTSPAGLRNLEDPNNPGSSVVPGTGSEIAVSGVKIILFNGPNASSVVTKVVDLTSAEAGNPGESGSTASDAFQVPASSKTLLVIVNPANLPTITAGTTTYAQVNAAVTNAAVASVTPASGFMMTNSKGDLEPSDANGNTTSLTLYNDEATAQSNAMIINVDRVVAKVRVYIDSYTSATAAVSGAEWVLNVTNKSYFPVSKRIKTWNEDPSFPGRGTCITPFDQYKIGSYRIDPNYEHVTNAAWGYNSGTKKWDWATVPTIYGGNYNYFTQTGTPGQPSAWNAVDTGSEYCLENTQDSVANQHAFTTQVLLKATFLPKGLGLPKTTTTVDVAAGQDWMIIGGYYFTYATLMEWIEYELTQKYSSANPSIYVNTYTTGFNAYLTAIGLTAVTLDEPVVKDTDPVAKAQGYRADFEALKTAVEAKGAQQFKELGTGKVDVSYYKAGVTYYKIMIKHDDSDTGVNQLGEFGVVRNSVYDVRISKFNNPGYPIIPDPDPNTPDEKDQDWLSIKININPWTWYSQIEEL